METILAISILVLGTGAIAFFTWERYDFAKAQVLGELGRLHATRIELSVDWMDFDRDTVTFDVEYSATDGTRHANRCKVPSSPMASAGVYWERPLRGAA